MALAESCGIPDGDSKVQGNTDEVEIRHGGASSVGGLRELRLVINFDVTFDSLYAFARHHPNLERFYVSGSIVDDVFLRAEEIHKLAKALPKLKLLTVITHNEFYIDDIMTLEHGCPSLEVLTVYDLSMDIVEEYQQRGGKIKVLWDYF